MSLKNTFLATGAALALLLVQAAPASAVEDVLPPNAQKTGGRPNKVAKIKPVTQADLAKPAGDEWLSYHGSYRGDHYSTLSDVNVSNVGKLQRA